MKAIREQERLRTMGGNGFDQEFVRYMIDDHRQDIADFRGEAHEMHGPASKLAREQLPTLRKHLDMALAIANGSGQFSRR
jgi:putative membrane protein